VSFISAKAPDEAFEEWEEVLDTERAKLCAELATYRSELIEGFAYPARRHRCNFVCRRLNEIDALLAELEE
jgi:hypothetical protein